MNKYRTFIRNHVTRPRVPTLRVRKINITEKEDEKKKKKKTRSDQSETGVHIRSTMECLHLAHTETNLRRIYLSIRIIYSYTPHALRAANEWHVIKC